MASDLKKSLRASLCARLAALTEAERTEKSAAAAARLEGSAEFKNAAAVLLYASVGTEVITRNLLSSCLAHGKVLCLPRTDAASVSMMIHAVQDLGRDLEVSRFGFSQPLVNRPLIPLDQIDLIVTPGIGFDLHGHRLGRGAGYYDRFLSRPGLRAAVCALAFECQVVPEIPSQPHDKPVQVIFTEDRVIRP